MFTLVFKIQNKYTIQENIMFGLFLQLAPAAGAAPISSDGGMMGSLSGFLPIILMVVFMYLLIFLPENRRRKKKQQQIEALKQGDRVITLGHIIGTIEFIGDKSVYIKSNDSKLEIAKSGIASVIEPGKYE